MFMQFIFIDRQIKLFSSTHFCFRQLTNQYFFIFNNITKANSVFLFRSKDCKMTRKCILLFIIVMLVDYYALARRPSCPICSPKLCPKPKNCKGGTVMDFCNCCLVCAKVEGELCGGKWMIEGTCDAKLTCVPRDRHHRSPWTNIGHCEPGKRRYYISKCNSLFCLNYDIKCKKNSEKNPSPKWDLKPQPSLI